MLMIGYVLLSNFAYMFAYFLFPDKFHVKHAYVKSIRMRFNIFVGYLNFCRYMLCYSCTCAILLDLQSHVK